MPKGVYKHYSHQGFQKGHPVYRGFEKGNRYEFKKGHLRLNTGGTYFKKDYTPWNKGKYLSKEIKIKMANAKIGKNNPSWKNGISKKPYPFEWNKELKEKIQQRDNYICQNCNMTEEEHLIVIGKRLTVHHIDYNKINCEENNLITLCQQCNARVNYNREYWKEIFIKKYGLVEARKSIKADCCIKAD